MRFRFSVRTVLMVVAVLAVGLGWVASRLRVARQNEHTIAELRGMMAFATLDDGTVPRNSKGIGAALKLRRVASVRNVTSDEVLAKLSTLKHLRRVEIMGPVTDSGIANLKGMRSLEDLRIASERITDSGLSQLSRLVNLEVLELSGSQLSDDCLQWVKGLKKLKVLRLGGISITDAGLRHVGRLHQLEELKLNGTDVTNVGLKQLDGLTKLDRIDLTGTRATMGGLAHLFVDLQGRDFGGWFPAQIIREDDRVAVTLSGQQYQDDVIPYLLEGVPEMTELELTSTGITDEGLAKLGELKRLRFLTLRNGKVELVEGFANLERLSLMGLGDRPLPKIRKLPKLQQLSLTDYPRTDTRYMGNGLGQLIELAEETPGLHTLNLERTAINDNHIAQLTKLKQLKELNLGGTEITDHALKLLSDMPNLESLQIRGTEVTDTGLRELTGLQRLRYLGLSSNRQITDAGIRNLKTLASLREIGLVHTGVTQSGYDELQAALPHCKILYP